MLTIVGLDPGTTLGLAILDLDSNAVCLDSYRVHDLKTVINKIFEFGRPLVLATDKVKVPAFIQNLSSKVGLKVVTPKYDLLLKEKNEINRIYGNLAANSHERDALAGAFLAYKSLRFTIEKVRKGAPEEKFEDALFQVITKEQNLSSVLKLLSNQKIKQNNKTFFRSKSETEKQKLSNRISELKSQVRLLKFEMFELKSKIKEKELKIKSLNREIHSKVYSELERKHKDLIKVISDKESALKIFSEKIKVLEEKLKHLTLILSSDVLVVVPKLVSLKNENQVSGKYLFVKNCLVDESIINSLLQKGCYVLTRNRKLNSLVYVDKILYEADEFVILRLTDLEKAIKSRTQIRSLSKLFEDYRKNRNKKDSFFSD